MRVISGKYKGRRLRTVAGLEVRPTSDRLRETLFDMLGQRLDGKSFLDVCAGSGAVGIEALSRGAERVTFIEQSRKAAAVIRENLELISDNVNAEVIVRDAVHAIAELEREHQQFDVIFFDPPYASPIYEDAIKRIAAGGILAEGGALIVEHRAKMSPELKCGELRMYREVRQGESALAFYARI